MRKTIKLKVVGPRSITYRTRRFMPGDVFEADRGPGELYVKMKVAREVREPAILPPPPPELVTRVSHTFISREGDIYRVRDGAGRPIRPIIEDEWPPPYQS